MCVKTRPGCVELVVLRVVSLVLLVPRKKNSREMEGVPLLSPDESIFNAVNPKP